MVDKDDKHKGIAKSAFIDEQYGSFQEMANRLPYVSDQKAVFYSGGRLNGHRASQYASKNGMHPIQETKAGKFLNQIDTYTTFGEKRYGNLWGKASRKYAAAVEGKVTTFVTGSQPASIFRKIELPTLINNKKVKEINGVERAKIDKMKRDQFARLRQQGVDKREAAQKVRDASHRKVAVAEVRQDLQRARQTNDKKLEADAKQRLQATRDQHKAEVADAQKIKAQQAEQRQKQESRQEIKARVDQLRERKLAADQSGDRQKKIEARKANQQDVQEMRAAQHEKIREQTAEQAVEQDKKQQADRTEAKDQGQPRQQPERTEAKQKEQPEQHQGHQAKKGFDGVSDKQYKEAQKYDADRFKAIEQRAEAAAKERGADEGVAKKAGEDRVRHVKEKLDLNAERAELRTEGVNLKRADAKEHFEKEAEFRDERQKDLAEQAKQEERPYQGPPEKSKELRAVETDIQTREFTERTRLDGRLTAETHPIDQHEHQKKSEYLEGKLAEYREADMAAYHQSQQQTSTQDHSIKHGSTSSQDSSAALGIGGQNSGSQSSGQSHSR